MREELWLYGTLLLILLGVIFRQGVLATFGFLVLATGSLSWLWKRFVFHGVHYARGFSEHRAFVGETIDFTLTVANRKLLPLAWLEVEDLFPERLPLIGKELTRSHLPMFSYLTHLTAMRWYERATWHYKIVCKARGYYRFGPARLKSGDLFGFFNGEERGTVVDHLLVYPQTLPLARLGLPSRRPFGEVRGGERIYEDPIRMAGLREYQETDPMKRIHWKASARRQALQTKLFEPSITLQFVVLLNIDTFAFSWEGTDPELLEQAITVSASIAQYGIEQRYEVGLLANGSLIESAHPIKILPSRHPSQITRILEALAMVTPMATLPFDRLVATEGPRLPWGATIVVVTAVITEGLLEALQRLRNQGYRISLLSLARGGKRLDLRGIIVYQLGEILPVGA